MQRDTLLNVYVLATLEPWHHMENVEITQQGMDHWLHEILFWNLYVKRLFPVMNIALCVVLLLLFVLFFFFWWWWSQMPYLIKLLLVYNCINTLYKTLHYIWFTLKISKIKSNDQEEKTLTV